jgi:NTP pyrophosphatase (non-canonical NTP hydrolase)
MDAQSRLSFEAFQASAKKTAIYNQDARVLYPALGLAGEVGELGEKVLQMAVHAGKCANQVKKIIRDDDCECDTPRKHDIAKEIGGVLWYCAAVASDLGLDLGVIAQENLDVLASRLERGTIKGDGDNR